MRELDKKDLSWAVRLLPDEIVALMKRHGPELILGGGYLRATIANEKVNDLDLFTSSATQAKLYADFLAAQVGRKLYETPNAYSLRLPRGHFVQFIHRWTFPRPEALLESFDFTIACAAIWVKSGKWTSLADDNFYSDLGSKRLVYRSPARNEDAGGSLLRVLKYYQRGYRIPLDSLGAVLARIHKGTTDGEYVNEKDIAAEYTRLLVTVDPQVDPTHEAHLPAEDPDAIA